MPRMTRRTVTFLTSDGKEVTGSINTDTGWPNVSDDMLTRILRPIAEEAKARGWWPLPDDNPYFGKEPSGHPR